MFQVGLRFSSVWCSFGPTSILVHCGRLTFLELRGCAFAKSEWIGGVDWILAASSRVLALALLGSICLLRPATIVRSYRIAIA